MPQPAPAPAPAPVPALPPEIWAAIFALCPIPRCDLRCRVLPPPQTPAAAGPLPLSHVCTRWRAIIAASPGLWTNVHVRPVPNDRRRLRLSLARSANLPLHVVVCAVDKNLLSSACLVPLLRLLFPYFHRIQSLKLSVDYETLATLFSAVRLPRMSDLELIVHDPRNLIAPFGQAIAPNLQRLCVRDMTLIHQGLGSTLPTLTGLKIEYCHSWKYPQIFAQLLASCVRLQTCYLTFPDTFAPRSMPRIELPDLLSLTLDWDYLFHAAPVFSALRAPNLRSLRLVHHSLTRALPNNVLGALCPLAQSAPALRVLTVEGCNLPRYHEVHGLLARCPALEHLTVARSLRGEQFLAPLTPAATKSPWLCPRLTHVTLDTVDDTGVRPVLTFAKARAANEPDDRAHTRHLEQLALHTEVYELTRHARLLLMSGLLDVRHVLDIAGPFGALLNEKSACSISAL